MTKEELIRNLKYTMEKHKNDKVDTFGTNISLMCKDVLDYLEQQPSEDCVSRAKVIDELNRLGRNAFKDDTDYDNFFAFVDSLPPVTPTQSWIPISEEMPKEGETVLVCYRTQEGISQSACEWFDMPNRGIVWSTLCGNTPIAWQPLPKAYGEK